MNNSNSQQQRVDAQRNLEASAPEQYQLQSTGQYNEALPSNLKAVNGQFNPNNFQTGIPNIDLNSLGPLPASLNFSAPPNLLADIPGLENLNSNPQLSSLLGLADLPGKGQQLPTDQNPLLQNLGQNPEKLAQLAESKQDLNQLNLNNLIGMTSDKHGGQDAAKGQTTQGNLSQHQNLHINSGTTATSPGEKDPAAGGGQTLDKGLELSKLLQDIPGLPPGLALDNPGTAGNQIQDVAALTGQGGEPANALGQLANYDVTNQMKLEANKETNQFGQLGQLDYPGLQALQGLTNLPQDPNFTGLNQQNLGQWNTPGMQTNALLSQLQGLPSIPAANSTGIPGLGGLGLNPGILLNQFSQGTQLPGGMNQMMRQSTTNVLIPGSQAHVYNFNLKGPDYEIKLFVGGLAYQTQECDLIDYFKQFGRVVDAIVMRDRQTQRGRGFGFVKMRFDNKELAQENKNKLLSVHYKNPADGHKINGKLVDVKSADDYVKPQPGQQPTPTANVTTQLLAMTKDQKLTDGGHQMPRTQPEHLKPNSNMKQVRDEPNALPNVTKPNPYVIVKQKEPTVAGGSSKDGDQKDDEGKEIVFEYPKSKIFVGGLDFKLNNDELRQHFLHYGAIESAVILKDINTGQSRGFGFVTFKEEAVAQNLIQNIQHTNILGRKVDIKSAEPKQQGMNQPPPIIPRRFHNGGLYGQGQNGQGNDRQQNQFAMIPQYGDSYKNDGQQNRRGGAGGDSPQEGFNDSQSSNNYPSRRGGEAGGSYRRGENQGRNDGYGPPGSQSHPNGPHFDYRNERERGHNGYGDRRDYRRRDDRERPRGGRDRRDDFEGDRMDGRGDRDRGRRRGRYAQSRSDSIDSSRSSSSYNNHNGRGNRGDERRGRHRTRRGPHHGGPGRASPSQNEQEAAQ